MFMRKVDTKKLVEDLCAIISDAEELLKATAGNTNEKIAATHARAEQSLLTAQTTLEQTKRQLVTQVKDAAQSTDAYVHDNTWKALGIAAGAGIVLGLLLNARNSSNAQD